MKTATKIEIGTTYPHFWIDRYVNAEVVSRRKEGGRWLWKVRLTESQQPVRRVGGFLDGSIVEFEYGTARIAPTIEYINSHPAFGPARQGSAVVQWIKFPGENQSLAGGLWCEVREQVVCGGSRPTHWQKCEYGTVEALLASGDAAQVSCQEAKSST